MLLSTPQPIILTHHIILLFFNAALAQRGATGRALARLRARVQVQVRKNFGVFKDGDLEYDNCVRAAHIALREKVFFWVKNHI